MSNNTLTMMAVGDIVLASPEDGLLALAAPTLKTADVLIGQQEVPFTSRGISQIINSAPPVGENDSVSGIGENVWTAALNQPITTDTDMKPRGPGVDPISMKELAETGFDIIHVAGNHTYDAGLPGIEDTINGLKEYGIACCGCGKTLDEARRPALIERGGMRFGCLSYNCVGPMSSWASPTKPGCAYITILTAYHSFSLIGNLPSVYTFAEPASLQAMVDDIRKLRSQCDVLVVHLHKGMAFIPVRLASYEKQVSHAAIDAGADLVVGDHSHMLKGIENYRGKWIFHNFGDFAWRASPPSTIARIAQFTRDHGGPFFFGPGHKMVPFPHNYWQRMTIIAKFIISNGKITQASYLPCYPNEKRQVEILKHDKRGQEVYDYIENATQGAALNAKFEWKGDEVLLKA
jgi:poly-gamma-glutamate capsule biosynthesis protein CapA/YwtB (metallophosphatase superfamily)